MKFKSARRSRAKGPVDKNRPMRNASGRSTPLKERLAERYHLTNNTGGSKRSETRARQ